MSKLSLRSMTSAAMLGAALAMGFSNKEGGIKQHKEITRNWKEDQDPNDRFQTLEKAKAKRLRKAKIKERNLQRSIKGK